MDLRSKRAFFDSYGRRPAEQEADLPPGGIRFSCPSWGYPTLDDRGDYSICSMMLVRRRWPGDEDADEVRGGPNSTFSLSDARDNFERYLVMYPPDQDTRVSRPDSSDVVQIRQELVAAFDAMMRVPDSEGLNQLWREVVRCERALDRELKRSLHEYSRRQAGPN